LRTRLHALRQQLAAYAKAVAVPVEDGELVRRLLALPLRHSAGAGVRLCCLTCGELVDGDPFAHRCERWTIVQSAAAPAPIIVPGGRGE
jgi:hypothetical protein